jgi:hypothetical protein
MVDEIKDQVIVDLQIQIDEIKLQQRDLEELLYILLTPPDNDSYNLPDEEEVNYAL